MLQSGTYKQGIYPSDNYKASVMETVQHKSELYLEFVYKIILQTDVCQKQI